MDSETPRKMITAWIVTRGCLVTGTLVEVVGAEVSTSGQALKVTLPAAMGEPQRERFFHKPAWHEDRAEAVAHACTLRDAAIREHEAEIARLQLLTF